MNIKKLNPQLDIADNHTLLDFWQWAYSDVMNNRNRAVFAEFLVGAALNCIDCPRTEWDPYDLLYKDTRIEVKTSAYLQSWYQKKPSTIVYDIGKKNAWDKDTNDYTGVIARNSEIYVFCLLAEQDSSKVNVLDVGQWQFIVIPTTFLDDTFSEQKTVTLSRLMESHSMIAYPELTSEIERVIKKL